MFTCGFYIEIIFAGQKYSTLLLYYTYIQGMYMYIYFAKLLLKYVKGSPIAKALTCLTRKSVHGTRMPPPIVFISPAIKHWVYNK